MALDVLGYHEGGSELHFEFSERLHQSIFRNIKPKKNSPLYRIRDYYLTDCSFSGDEIETLSAALGSVDHLITAPNAEAFEGLIKFLRQDGLVRVAFAGD
ncbi:hypothetical protein RRX38_15465 [Pseudomonas sp. DTU_2021_1001937_2_SI_NGA_ILE_001]|uniref:hypothetical protein n=1 Tax=Pseudomonas sp. DTU_2021_1001937_2_SI_NGA_ILE_001 TaxID=3077589 RepID=UPI0028FC1504|nr:hypothetical protein [Pseudomonas sp. DTU_2021_1001937_2_SI_NGA_ILE_001]WNW12483.1 hypothetical protein RRX38_15465 [Pseudomonas sp. DTU_2021_1001937_2_SI_NGA_ILE_001]